jgi:hypothetical protein
VVVDCQQQSLLLLLGAQQVLLYILNPNRRTQFPTILNNIITNYIILVLPLSRPRRMNLSLPLPRMVPILLVMFLTTPPPPLSISAPAPMDPARVVCDTAHRRNITAAAAPLMTSLHPHHPLVLTCLNLSMTTVTPARRLYRQ